MTTRESDPTPYPKIFYDPVHAGVESSARCILPLVLSHVPARSIVDVGCGTGTWLRVARECGVERTFGIDGPWSERSLLEIDERDFRAARLDGPWEIAERFDLAMSLDVAAHLPPESAESFVERLTALAPIVLFAAALPGQGGLHHVNERWLSYWAELFGRRDFRALDVVRPAVWQRRDVLWWYAQNCLLFVSDEQLAANARLRRAREAAPRLPLDLVHPQLFLREWQARQAPRLADAGPRRLAGAFVRAMAREMRARVPGAAGKTRAPTALPAPARAGASASGPASPARAPTPPTRERQQKKALDSGYVAGLGLLNDWFDRVVVFTIPRNESRRMKRLRQVLRDVRFEEFEGYDQKLHSRAELKAILAANGFAEPPDQFSDAVLAHAAGMGRLLLDIVARGTPRTLFIEDDFEPTAFAASVLAAARSELEGGVIDGAWDVVHFHSHLACTPPDQVASTRRHAAFPAVLPEMVRADGLPWSEWVRASTDEPDRIFPFRGGRQYIPDGNGGYLRYVYRGYYENLSTLCVGLSLAGVEKILARRAEFRGSDYACGVMSEEAEHRNYLVSPFPCRSADSTTLSY